MGRRSWESFPDSGFWRGTRTRCIGFSLLAGRICSVWGAHQESKLYFRRALDLVGESGRAERGARIVRGDGGRLLRHGPEGQRPGMLRPGDKTRLLLGQGAPSEEEIHLHQEQDLRKRERCLTVTGTAGAHRGGGRLRDRRVQEQHRRSIMANGEWRTRRTFAWRR